MVGQRTGGAQHKGLQIITGGAVLSHRGRRTLTVLQNLDENDEGVIRPGHQLLDIRVLV